LPITRFSHSFKTLFNWRFKDKVHKCDESYINDAQCKATAKNDIFPVDDVNRKDDKTAKRELNFSLAVFSCLGNY